MPTAGRKQKPPGQAVTRHAPLEWDEIPDVPFKGGPKLPGTRPNGKPWSTLCIERWKVYSSMPHCTLWSKADWAFALDTMSVVAKFFDTDVDPRLAAELRNREKIMGTTHDFRRDIRVRYVDPPTEAAKVVGLDDYQDL